MTYPLNNFLFLNHSYLNILYDFVLLYILKKLLKFMVLKSNKNI